MLAAPPQPAYAPATLLKFAAALFAAAGCDGDKPPVMARVLVEADLLGHTTHGLALAGDYLEELETGKMQPTGEPQVLSDRGAALAWDGGYLPGPWLVSRALDLACERATRLGLCAVSIRRSHHIACLAAYLEQATRRGLMAIIASSDPSAASVAPFGGRGGVFSPDPLAVGIPTASDPILIDASASITTNGLSTRLRREGRRYPGLWALDPSGSLTDDPNTLFATPPGALLPAGGLDHGQKGYSLAWLVESLTQGLGGFGRLQAPGRWGASVFIQVFDPQAFGGLAAYLDEMEWTAQACRVSPPIPGSGPVRLPGQAGLEKRRAALADGLRLYPGIIEGLVPWAGKFGVALPRPDGLK